MYSTVHCLQMEYLTQHHPQDVHQAHQPTVFTSKIIYYFFLQTMAPEPLVLNNSVYTELLLTNLSDLQSAQTFTDFTIKVHDVSIPCHKIMLAAACPYFRAMYLYIIF